MDETVYLKLTALSSITVEDLYEMVMLRKDLCDQKERDIIIRHAKELTEYNEVLGTLRWWHIDYLRSKGYSFSWMGLSVEEMVHAGWIKLQEH